VTPAASSYASGVEPAKKKQRSRTTLARPLRVQFCNIHFLPQPGMRKESLQAQQADPSQRVRKNDYRQGATRLVRMMPMETRQEPFTHLDLLECTLKTPCIGRPFHSMDPGAWLLRATWTKCGQPYSKDSTLPI